MHGALSVSFSNHLSFCSYVCLRWLESPMEMVLLFPLGFGPCFAQYLSARHQLLLNHHWYIRSPCCGSFDTEPVPVNFQWCHLSKSHTRPLLYLLHHWRPIALKSCSQILVYYYKTAVKTLKLKFKLCIIIHYHDQRWYTIAAVHEKFQVHNLCVFICEYMDCSS